MAARGFFSTLNYSSVNEDWRTELRALDIGRGDRVLAVTGSGDRALDLLVGDPSEVTAVDASDAQGETLRLKIAAMSLLPYDEYVAFLGLTPHADRARVLESLARSAPLDYWQSRSASVVRGILYEGRWERYYRNIARVARAMRGRAIERLFEFRDLAAQRAFVRDTWDRRWWRAVFDVMCSPTFSRVFLRDPAFFAHVDPRMRVGRYIYEGMLRALESHLARENFMVSLVFRGRLAEDDLPPYLALSSFESIKGRVARIGIETADIVRFLERADPGRFTRFSLSDVPSYLDPREFERLLDAIVHAAAPGSRFCIRQFLSGHQVPPRFHEVLAREPALEETLRVEDRAFAYRFIVGRVRK